MPTPNIIFQKGKNGLKRPLPGEDYISGFVLYTAVLPAGFTTTNNIQQLFQPADAQTYGILSDYSDAVAATATWTITNIGAIGDVVTIASADIDDTGNNLNDDGSVRSTILCAYKRLSGDTTIATLGQSVTAAINAGTLTHGYSASFNVGTAVLTVTAPLKFGVFLNSGTPLSVVIAGAIAGTLVNFGNGTFSQFAVWNYFISEFFRIQPQGYLYVGFFPVPGSYLFPEVNTLQNFAKGKIRQVATYKDFSSAWSNGDLQALSNACVVSDTAHKPLSALYSANLVGTAQVSSLPDLSTQLANKTTPVIGMDAGGRGWFLFKTTGKSVPALGAALGMAAFVKVSESIGWVDKCNASDGIELNEVAFANGQLLSDPAISDTLLDAINDRRYTFLKKYVGSDGSYFNGGTTAISVSSDYAYLENNRTIDKAIRGIYSSLLPSLNGPIKLNADGTLSENTTAAFESAASINLDQMVRDGEISAFDVFVNPNQNVLQTNNLIVTVELVINGVARTITVPIGFVPKIA